MKQYLNLVKEVMEYGTKREDRTGTGTTDLFGPQMQFDLRDGFPLMTTKKVNFRNVAGELIWILRGSTNNNDLREITYGHREQIDKSREELTVHNTIWEPWANHKGRLGPVYGSQLRYWNECHADNDRIEDQLKTLLYNLEHKPFSRRHVVSLWNACDLPEEDLTHEENIDIGFGVLPPCHCLFQFHVEELPVSTYENGKRLPVKIELKKHLSCKLYQRSADMFIGVPYNIASYALLTHIIAHRLNMIPYRFIHTFGSAHVYSNHYDQVNEQLKRTPGELPRLIIKRDRENIWEHEIDDFDLLNYNPQKFIKAPVSI